MSIENFPDLLEIGVLESNGSLVLGGYSVDTEIELRHIPVLLYKNGGSVTNERVRLRMTSDAAGTRTILTSEWSNLSESTNINDGDYWLGWLRVDFTRTGIAKDITRYLVLDVDNYTRNGDTYYIGVAKDYPLPIYSDAATSFEQAAFAVTIFGFEDE